MSQNEDGIKIFRESLPFFPGMLRNLLHEDPDSVQAAAGYLSLQLCFVEEKELGIKGLEKNPNKQIN